MNEQLNLSNISAYFFDLDGCIYYGETAAPGAVELLNQLRADSKKVGFITNNSRNTDAEIASRLTKMGITAYAGEVVSATESVGRYISNRYGSLTIKSLGSNSLMEALAQAGHRVLNWDDQERAEAVVIGRDIEFTYEKLTDAANEIIQGARPIACNSDMYHPDLDGGLVPETGAIVAAIEALIDRRIESVGKPSPDLFRLAMERFDVKPEDAVMIGDNLLTDIIGGQRAGLATIWIDHKGSGIGSAEVFSDMAIRSLQQLAAWYSDYDK